MARRFGNNVGPLLPGWVWQAIAIVIFLGFLISLAFYLSK